MNQIFNPLKGATPRWVLIPYVWMPAWTGFWYIFGSDERFMSPSFGAAKLLTDGSMTPYGIVCWLIAAVLLLGIRLTPKDENIPSRGAWVTVIGLLMGSAFCTLWATMLGAQAANDVHASPTGPAYISLVGFMYFVTAIRVASGK